MKEFSNFNQLRRNASTNFTNFKKAQNIYGDLKEKDKMYSNLEYAQGLITSLIEDNDIMDNDINHQILSKSLDNMTTIYSKSNISNMEIENFYTSFEGIEDINNKLRGGKK